MALNPNVPYEVFEGGIYVGLPSMQAEDGQPALIRKSDYKAFEEKFIRLRHDTREILGKLAFAVATPDGLSRRLPSDPLAGLSAARRDMVIADMKKQNVGWCNEANKTFGLGHDEKTIVRDLQHAKKGFHTPVYNVMGKPVFGDHFDIAGNLSRQIARHLGVPPLRKDAVVARPVGLRSDITAVPAPQATRAMMPPPRQPVARSIAAAPALQTS